MMRRVYIFLLSFHPRPFRERFSTEMLGIFDEESKNGLPLRLLWDAAVSLIRQRTLRGGQVPPPVACTGGSQRIVWMFQTIEHPPMSRSALIHGRYLRC